MIRWFNETSRSTRLLAGGVLVALAACTAGELKEGDLTAPNPVVAVHLAPGNQTLQSADAVVFTALVELADGTTLPSVLVSYSATGGTFVNNLYTAGTEPGIYSVIATMGELADTSIIQILEPPPTEITAIDMTPGTASLLPGGQQQFAVQGRQADGTIKQVDPTFTATGGTITSSGLYRAGSTGGTYRVIASIKGGAVADTSPVTIASPPAQLTGVLLTPGVVTIGIGQTQQFLAVGTLSDGLTTIIGINWSVVGGGTVSNSGLYTAGGTTGTARVIATAQGSSFADTTVVTIVPPPSGNFPNRPVSFTNVLSEYQFDDQIPTGPGVAVGGGWYANNEGRTLAIVNDPTAPVSPGNVLQWTYAAGQGSPSSSASFGLAYHSIPANVTRIYIAFSLWHDPNFEFNPVSNKLFYLEPGNVILESWAYAGWYSLYNGSVQAAYSPQTNTPIVKGQWERVEYLVDADADNVKVWINGQLRMNVNTPMAGNWRELKLDSTWGGGNGPTKRTSYRRVDNIMIATP